MIQRSFIVLFLIFAQHVLSDRRPLYELRSSKTFFIEVKGLKLKSVRLNDTKEILLRESPDSFPSDVVVCRTADGAGDGYYYGRPFRCCGTFRCLTFKRNNNQHHDDWSWYRDESYTIGRNPLCQKRATTVCYIVPEFNIA